MTIAILGIFFVVAMGAGLYVAGRVPGTANWVLGGIAGVLGMGGLFVSARSGVHAPVGYWGGSTCMDVEVTDYACDSAHQQIPPVKALGHEYAAVRYRARIPGMNESVPWRLVGAVDGTVLSYQPAAPAGHGPGGMDY